MAYDPVIPEIAKAYQNDPRTKIAQALLAQGGSTAPVAQGKYAWADGLARALQGISGAYITNRQQKKFGEREREYQRVLAEATAGIGDPAAAAPAAQAAAMAPPQAAQPAPAPMGAPAAGQVDLADMRAPMAPSSGPLQAVDPNTALNPPQAPPAGAMDPQKIASALAPPPAQAAPQMRPPMAPPAAMPPRQQPMKSSSEYFMNGIVPIEGGTDKAGRFRTSPAGAIGPAQVMPATAPYAAKLAGVPFNGKLYRSDAAYNLKLGQAYYDKMLETFDGDPVKAAAAYNAGPGGSRVGRRGVRGAIRAATKAGDPENWVAFLPAETRKYVQNFTARFGGDVSGASVQDAGEAAPVQTPRQMEQQAPAPEVVARPNAPEVPEAVQSQRLTIAQRLLKSGNADLVSLAQGYLDLGLGEKFQADTQRNSQQFQQGQTGYQADLNDFTDSRSAARQNTYQSNRDIANRNFDRETQEDAQTYGTAERIAADRQRMRELQFGRQQSLELARLNNDAAWRQTQAEIDARAGTAEDKRAAKRQAFIMSREGSKMATEAAARIEANDVTLSKLDEIEAINQRQRTGGVLGTPILGDAVGYFNDDVRQFEALTNAITINDSTILKGSLSDSDRTFVLKAQPSVKNGNKANQRIIEAKRNALRRQNEFETAKINAIADGDLGTFLRDWSEYRRTVSIDPSKNKNGYKSFDEWRTPTKRYDTAGNEIK